MTIADLTDKQLIRLFCRVWQRMTAGDGYQPFGYDAVTLWATNPGWMAIIAEIKAEAKRRGLR